jgi:opacity protein-like surface antigen
MDFNANLHYVFNVAKNINLYPVGGITVVTTHGLPDGVDNITMVGANLGGGAEFFIAPQLKLNLELKYQYAEKEESYSYSLGSYGYRDYTVKYEAEGPVFQAGLAFCF